MKKFLPVVATMAAAMLATTAVRAADVEVIHWWTSGGEQAAVTVFANEFDALGGDKWIDTAIALGETARAAVMQRALGGDPPEAAQFNPGRQYEELIAAGLLLDLTPLAEAEGWSDIVRPDTIESSCHIDGKWWCVPVNIHSWQWGWASIPAFEKVGLAVPKNMDEFIAAAPKLKEAGIIPFAVGGDGGGWQISGMAGVLQLNMLGVELRDKIFRDLDTAAAAGPEVTKVFETVRSLQQYSDDGSVGRNWNDTTNLVITDAAAFQIMGDWARGEFSVAGEQPGVDYECVAGPADKPYLNTGGDIFVFFKQNDPDVERAQLKLASMMINPRVQALFNNAKGSLPVRDDVDMSLADACMKKGLALLADPATVVADVGQYRTEDFNIQMNDLWTDFWFNPETTVEQAQARFVDLIANAD